ncbi:hypothetical protein ARMGADRAFT_1035695 [Armillaria gallica]|uniref:Aminoglycoside phosphotransferase domain-containing protein n=1 Tax=Armillaria gallica TaxID=47427 RepID=A0A2H3CT83_ARMGA|nr:hypothetical protein ARMGADRAFT_1035695 [Armillaria gallica]
MIPQPVLAVFYVITIVIVDTLLICFGPSTDVDCQTDDEVLNLCYSVPKKDWTMLGCPSRLTPDVVAKQVPRLPMGWPLEALAQDLVHNCTNIPIPPIWHVLNLNPFVSVIVMDYIPGITLAEAWPTMRLWQKIRTAITLRSYICQLRVKSLEYALHHTFSGPFKTSEELIRLFNDGMDQAMLAQSCMHKGPLADNGTLVYSHVDFALRNLIVGDDSQLLSEMVRICKYGHGCQNGKRREI